MIFSHHPRKVGIMKNYRGVEAEAMVPSPEWEFDPTKVYDQDASKLSGMKPHGFWLSVDDDWKRWCTEDAEWEVTPPFFFDINMERVLLLSSAAELQAFTKEYGIYEDRYSGRGSLVYKVRWEEVAEKYAGIVIAPYIWSMRMDMEVSWYYSWDCASACIWDLSVLTAVGVKEDA